MKKSKMHIDEVEINSSLIQELLAKQFPQWKDLNLQLITPEGTDNAMYKLGNDKVVRLPRMANAAKNIIKEIRTLPQLIERLTINIPKIIGSGEPSTDYPFLWLICNYLEGTNPDNSTDLDLEIAANDLGYFIQAMRNIAPDDGPRCNRGLPLSSRDQETRDAILRVSNIYNESRLMRFWQEALELPEWQNPPHWIHGDLHPGNMLAKDKKITAIVDFGSTGVGDPACDLMVAWTMLTASTRPIFRDIVKPDDATWRRGRAWAFTFGLVAYPYYRESNPSFAKIAKRAVDEVLSEY